jgi:hypothetical protein
VVGMSFVGWMAYAGTMLFEKNELTMVANVIMGLTNIIDLAVLHIAIDVDETDDTSVQMRVTDGFDIAGNVFGLIAAVSNYLVVEGKGLPASAAVSVVAIPLDCTLTFTTTIMSEYSAF